MTYGWRCYWFENEFPSFMRRRKIRLEHNFLEIASHDVYLIYCSC